MLGAPRAHATRPTAAVATKSRRDRSRGSLTGGAEAAWRAWSSLPAKNPAREDGICTEQHEQRYGAHPVRAPARAVPHALQERNRVRSWEGVSDGVDSAR